MESIFIIQHQLFSLYNKQLFMEPIQTQHKVEDVDIQTQNAANLNQNQMNNTQYLSESEESSDSPIQDDDESLQIERPKPQVITEDQCYEDDEIEDSDDDLIEEEDSMVYDSEQQQERQMQKEEEEKEIPKNKRKLELRDYQNILFNRSLNQNRIIYLPTGKGKTLVSIASMYFYLCKYGESKKIVFLANTIQLVKQQTDYIKRNLQKIMEDDELANSLRKPGARGRVRWTADDIKSKICCIHGQKIDEVGMTRRKKIQAELTNKKEILQLFKKSTIIVMIAQMFLNCLRRGYIKITDFSFIVFDECHHCHGNHPYAGIMRQFYFDLPSPSKAQKKRMQQREQIIQRPILMGLTASPVTLQTFDKTKLVNEIGQLCGNLDSRFTAYEVNKINNDTIIQIIQAVEKDQNREMIADLIAHFEKFRDHREAYNKLHKHFPVYFKCVKEVIVFLQSKNVYMDLQADPKAITDIQLLVFYDIKECLLVKIRDIWLQLGQYAFRLAFDDFHKQLQRLNLRNQDNKLILNQIIQIVHKYALEFQQLYPECKKKFFSAKVIKLIQLLESKDKEESMTQKQGKFEMVVVFAAKRRTVKYLDILLKGYSATLQNEEEKKYFKCDRVTGYSVKTVADYNKNEVIFDPDPSSMKFQAQSFKLYEAYMRELAQEKTTKQLRDTHEAESKNLASEMKRMGVIKLGKLLLQVQERYSDQIQKIKNFRGNKYRVLITTSVTEEGFDIPQCKIVVSFDKPSSLKSYIQIKGRARKQFSKYFIFTNERNYEEMKKSKDFYDDIINATFEIAINQFSDEAPNKEDKDQLHRKPPAIIREEQGYQKVIIKDSGAIVNTSYALEILKMYCASLRQPNKMVPFYIQTPNVAFRCIIYFPKTAPTSKAYIIGKSKPNKNLALKSAAFQAVKYLFKEKYIKADLRPKKYEELEDERQIEKFEDLEQTRRNEEYKKIFEQEVRVKCQQVVDRKFMRFYFKTLISEDLDFPKINPLFDKHKHKFEKQKFPFQVYMMNFTNSKNMKELRKSDENQQIGVLTCFQSKYNQEVFSGYEYSFEESSEKFTLKLQEENLQLNKAEYERLKRIHQFIITASLNREVSHYSQLTKKAPQPAKWLSELEKNNKEIQASKKREYYPILVILKKKNEKYTIDEQCNKNIEAHEKLFKQIYEYHNRSGHFTITQKFPLNLTQNLEQLLSQLKSSSFDGNLIVQSLEKEHCFSKCIITGKEIYNDTMEKDREKKKGLMTRNKKMVAMFEHAQENIREVVKIVFWNKYKKQRKKEIFERQGKLSVKEVQNSKYFLPWQFLIYPLSVSILFKAGLAVQFLFKAVFEYSLAFSFRNIKLLNICKSKMKSGKNICNEPYVYDAYPNVILENGPAIFKYLADNSGSNYLKNIGNSYNKGTEFSMPFYEFSTSKIMNMSMIDESTIQEQKNHTNNSSMNISGFWLSQTIDNTLNKSNLMVNNEKLLSQVAEQKSITLISEIKVTEVLKVLTSRMYKFNKLDNYEEYEFIGDVVLKMLSTVEVFLMKPKSDESQLHIARANIICNANLHRKAILKNIYKYILTKKCDQLPPPYSYSRIKSSNEPQYYQKTNIRLLDQNSQIEGYHYIPGKVHADIVEALIGAFYLHSKDLNDCQLLLYFLDILKKPLLKFNFHNKTEGDKPLPRIYSDFEDRIGYHFRNKGLLIQSLTHSSFKQILNRVVDETDIQKVCDIANQSLQSQSRLMSVSVTEFNKNINTKTLPWQTFYERLEFLGDSILDLIVVQYLHDKFGTKDEGTLTALKQAGVSNKTLGMIAISYGMHELILMDYPENDLVMKQFKKILENFNAYMNNPELLLEAKVNSIKILGDVFEALVGAIFVDLELDYAQTKEVVMKIIKDFLIHYTDLETMKKSSTFKYKEFLDKNNYRQCQMKKDTRQEIVNGKFKFMLVDRSGAIIDACQETTQKRAWDAIVEKFHNKQSQPGK